MKKLLIPICASLFLMLGATAANAQETAKGIIINTSSQAEVDKVLATLKNEDPSTYRLTVTTSKGGRSSSKVFGTAPIGTIGKLSGSKIGAKGGLSASDVIVAVKVITNGKELQNAVISQLNSNLTKKAVQSVKLNAARGGGK
ncbi:hypothetical protein [Pedobacter caeni]|uniref:CHRD domain-containing protein n=1 Tax=Pedobacter caeni TaxID=288992 RepID=A0A1M4WXV1_9SPHI|nr:hypothetical protein [Pedobacter caeni]SHE86020.1 hypothetical protein SAMN04488522_1011425 [Pedobacter caeni]